MTKIPRSASTSSWTILGIWNSIRLVRVAKVSPSLFRIELDDQAFLDGRVDLAALGPLENFSGQVVVVGLQPRSDRRGEVGRIADDLLRRRAGRNRDDVVRPDLVAGDVHAPAVYVEVAVADELPCLRARGCEAEPVDDVVEPCLEHPEQRLAGHARAARRLLVVRAELLLEQPVVAARLLLLAQLQQVLALLDTAAAVLARRIAAPLDRALLREAALALEEELHPLAAALLAFRA